MPSTYFRFWQSSQRPFTDIPKPAVFLPEAVTSVRRSMLFEPGRLLAQLGEMRRPAFGAFLRAIEQGFAQAARAAADMLSWIAEKGADMAISTRMTPEETSETTAIPTFSIRNA